MAYNTHIDIESDEIPVVFEVELGNAIYLMGINHNMEFGFLTVDIYTIDNEPLVLGEKMILGKPLFEDLIDERLPGPTIIPDDLSKNEDRITLENFGKTVFLYIDDGGDY